MAFRSTDDGGTVRAVMEPAPEKFDCPDIEAAKEIILVKEKGMLPAERWEIETAWLLKRMVFEMGLVLDFGCGIGRMAKAICGPALSVVGVDISETMREQALQYVKSDHFRAISPEDLDHINATGPHYDYCICVWVLQHVIDPRIEIERIAQAVKPGGRFYLVNRWHRAVPAKDGLWHPDGWNIQPMLLHYFDLERAEAMPETLCEEGAYFARYRRKAS